MFSSFGFEKALGFLVIVTLIAVFAEERLLATSMVIDPSGAHEISVYSDRVSGGSSEARVLDAEKYEWSCVLKAGARFPYCGFEVIFDAERMNGLDLRNQTKIRIYLDYEGPAETIRAYLRNFDPIYSIPGVNDTTKYNQVEFNVAMLDEYVELQMTDFFVANWWVAQHKVMPQYTHPQFDNIVVFEVQTGNGAPWGDYRFRINRLEFDGRLMSTQEWYQLILGAWLTIALLFLAVRLIFLNRELARRKTREQELLEVNSLLDTRSRTLEEMARTDPLTGAFNRQGIEDAIKGGLLDWRRERKPLSLVMLDVDFFKPVNDTYGHAVGDRVLMGIVELVQKNIRSHDLFARWGGEEFVLVCRDTPEQDAYKLAEKLRRLIGDHTFDGGISITVSIGVATLGETETLDQLFERADVALYSAKDGGRNRVELATSPNRSGMH